MAGSFSQDREPFVVVLLDGEGMIFKDEFLQLGEEGGRNAATQLYTSLHAYLASNLPSITTPKLLTKVYLNVKGLGDMCVRTGLVSDPSAIYDFIRGFNETMSFSEIVDVGCEKNKAFDKIQGSSKPYSSVTGKDELTVAFNSLQRPSKSSFTIVTATKSLLVAPPILNMLTFLKTR